jgi:hypothetical protein
MKDRVNIHRPDPPRNTLLPNEKDAPQAEANIRRSLSHGKRWKTPLTQEHIRGVLNSEIRIGSDTESMLRFVYNPWHRTYSIMRGAVVVKERIDPRESEVDELLALYNVMIGAKAE